MVTYFRKEVKDANSWKWIQENEHVLQTFDQFPIVLKNGEFAVITVGHDSKGKTYFCLEDCLGSYDCDMNGNNTNEDGWSATVMRKFLNTCVLALLPNEILNVIKPTKIVQIINGKRITTRDRLFLFSKTQVSGKGIWTEQFEPEDEQIDIFGTEKNRVKESGKRGTWWYFLRTPCVNSVKRFYSIDANGNSDRSQANRRSAIAFGFCIT